MLRPIDYGIVVKDLELKSEEYKTGTVEVFLSGLLASFSGDLTEEVTSKGQTNIKDTVKSNTVKSDVKIKCEWTPMGSNRVSPPLVKKGMQVQVLQVGFTDKYVWHTVHYQPELMQHDICLSIYGNSKVFKENMNKDNTYYTIVDTVNKLVQLHTSNNDDEACTYDIKLNTKNGVLTIVDGKNNKIELRSVAGALTIDTNSNVTINSPTVTVNASNINLNAESKLTLNSPLTEVNGGVLNINSNTNFYKPVKMNNFAKISNYVSASEHGSTIE